jgi:hypothetical protein
MKAIVLLAATVGFCIAASRPAHALSQGTCNACTPSINPSNQWNNQPVRPEIAIGFWGNTNSVWAAGSSESPSRTQLIADTLSIVDTPYFATLQQYGGAGLVDLPRMAPFAPTYIGNVPNSLDNTSSFQLSDIPLIINNRISVGAFPQPAGVNMVYIIFVPSGASAVDCGANGCNGGGVYTDGSKYRFGVVGGNTTVTLTHELAEAISAMQNITNSGPCGGQIADICNNTIRGVQCSIQETQNGVAVQAYWSQKDNACIIPEYFGGTVVQIGFNWNWVGQILMRQAYGGSGGVVYTDSSDLTWFGNGGATGTQIGSGQAGQLAVGAAQVVATTLDILEFPETGRSRWREVLSASA